MQSRIKRRSFLQGIFGVGALAALWSRVPSAQAQARAGLTYSDDIGTLDFATLYDGNLTTGIEYNV